MPREHRAAEIVGGLGEPSRQASRANRISSPFVPAVPPIIARSTVAPNPFADGHGKVAAVTAIAAVVNLLLQVTNICWPTAFDFIALQPTTEK